MAIERFGAPPGAIGPAGRGVSDRRPLVSVVAFALVLAAVSGALAQRAGDLAPAAAVVIVGGCLVGGIVPGRWWLAAIVGLGVPAARLLAPAAGEAAAPATSVVSTWIAPVVALAAGGLGGALLRHLREE